MELPVFITLVKKDFSLKDENAARLFESSLDSIYPIEKSDKAQVKHMKKNDEWIFIRGKFFDNYKAMIVKVDQNGVLRKISYSLSYKL